MERQCTAAVMQWIVEELKLRTEQRTLAWLTLGEELGKRRERGRRKGEATALRETEREGKEEWEDKGHCNRH